jgi:hypothetical protein
MKTACLYLQYAINFAIVCGEESKYLTANDELTAKRQHFRKRWWEKIKLVLKPNPLAGRMFSRWADNRRAFVSRVGFLLENLLMQSYFAYKVSSFSYRTQL